MKNKKLVPWIPTIVTLIITVPFAIYYAVFGDGRVSTYLEILAGALASAIFPVLGIITKKHYSLSLSVCVSILCILGIHFAKALNVYGYWQRYDIFLHTNFGLVGSAMLYALLLRWRGDKMNKEGQIIFILLGVLGVGALWEILEYTCSMFTGEDPQRCWGAVRDIIAAGGERVINPLYDTMQDLIVTGIGSAVFFIGYYIDDFCFKGKIYKKLFSQPGGKEELVAE